VGHDHEPAVSGDMGTEMEPPAYTHDTITSEQLRLLRFQPRQGECIQLNISTFDRETAPLYIALSYEWGEAATSDPAIPLGGNRYCIRTNLELFLQQLQRTLGTETWFWCDAICINQSDVPERNAHVQRMGDIYRNAIEVAVWLGPADEHTSMAFLPSDDVMDDVMDDYCPVTPDANGCQYTPEARKHAFAVYELLSRPYWDRVWIIQVGLVSTLEPCQTFLLHRLT